MLKAVGPKFVRRDTARNFDAAAPTLWVDEQAAQLRGQRVAVVAHDKDAADPFTAELGDPELLRASIMLRCKAREQSRNHCFELGIPPIFLGIEPPVALDRPTDVAYSIGPDDDRRITRCVLIGEGSFDGLHRLEQALSGD